MNVRILHWLNRVRRSARGSSAAARDFDPDAPYALCGRPQISSRRAHPLRGFSLIEVMIAMFVFFIVVFAILGMVVQSVGAARALQKQHADCGLVASMFSLSNTLKHDSLNRRESFFTGVSKNGWDLMVGLSHSIRH